MNSEFYKTTFPTCKICFEFYDHFTHKPCVILPSAHSACSECLNKLIKTTKICPIEGGPIENQKPNWDLIDMLDNAVPEPIFSLKNEKCKKCKKFEEYCLAFKFNLIKLSNEESFLHFFDDYASNVKVIFF
jgi:hypothetical protein